MPRIQIDAHNAASRVDKTWLQNHFFRLKHDLMPIESSINVQLMFISIISITCSRAPILRLWKHTPLVASLRNLPVPRRERSSAKLRFAFGVSSWAGRSTAGLLSHRMRPFRKKKAPRPSQEERGAVNQGPPMAMSGGRTRWSEPTAEQSGSWSLSWSRRC